MTIQPATLARSAVELHDDDGHLVATIYATAHGCVLMAEPGQSLDCQIDMNTPASHLGIRIRPNAARENAA